MVIRYGGYVNSPAGIPVSELVARGDFWLHNENGTLYLCHQVQHPFANETLVNGCLIMIRVITIDGRLTSSGVIRIGLRRQCKK